MSQELLPREAHSDLHDERRMSAIVADVWDNADKLVGQHLQLALAELETRVDHLKADLTIVTMGGLVLYAGLLSLLAAAILGLSQVVAPWLAALIVALAALGVGYLMLQRKSDFGTEPKPSPSVQSAKKTAHALKEAVK